MLPGLPPQQVRIIHPTRITTTTSQQVRIIHPTIITTTTSTYNICCKNYHHKYI